MGDMKSNRGCFWMVLMGRGDYGREGMKGGRGLRDMGGGRL